MSKVTIPDLKARKLKNGDTPIVAVTAYDAPTARIANEADVDLILVGDSVAMVMLGYSDTIQVTTDDIAYHVGAVSRAKPDAVIIGDMPWMSFHVSTKDTLENASKLIRAGAQGVKLEGGTKRIETINSLVDAEIPVMGHVGLTPQSVNQMGGFAVQGKTGEAIQQLVADVKALEAAGCFSIVLEGIPGEVGQLLTNEVAIPTIGIGAGNQTDGQIIVFHDAVGLENRFKPKFVRRYADSFQDQVNALTAYKKDVQHGQFPSEEESYSSNEEIRQYIELYGSAER